jgi:hypothetical protein
MRLGSGCLIIGSVIRKVSTDGSTIRNSEKQRRKRYRHERKFNSFLDIITTNAISRICTPELTSSPVLFRGIGKRRAKSEAESVDSIPLETKRTNV